jgi:hypothetical protein
MNNVQVRGWGAFAATVVLLAGAFHLIQGITAMAVPALPPLVSSDGHLEVRPERHVEGDAAVPAASSA